MRYTSTRTVAITATLATSLLSASANASLSGYAFERGYEWTGTAFGGAEVSGFVVDLYIEFNDPDCVLLNIYNWNCSSGIPQFYQGLTAAGWAPNEQGSIFTTEVSRSFDSFIAIGGVTEYGMDDNPYQMAGNGVAVDPGFGGNDAAAPGANAGWYNGNPSNPIGSAMNGPVLIGRFSVEGSAGFSLVGGTFEATWNKGIGTQGEQGTFVCIPAPGALAFLGFAGLSGHRRRRN